MTPINVNDTGKVVERVIVPEALKETVDYIRHRSVNHQNASVSEMAGKVGISTEQFEEFLTGKIDTPKDLPLRLLNSYNIKLVSKSSRDVFSPPHPLSPPGAPTDSGGKDAQ